MDSISLIIRFVKADRTVMLLECLWSKFCTYMYTNDVSKYRKEKEIFVYYGFADALVLHQPYVTEHSKYQYNKLSLKTERNYVYITLARSSLWNGI